MEEKMVVAYDEDKVICDKGYFEFLQEKTKEGVNARRELTVMRDRYKSLSKFYRSLLELIEQYESEVE